MISRTVSLFTVKHHNEKNNTTLLKWFHQCWDFTHNSSTNREIVQCNHGQSFPHSQAQYEVQYNTNVLSGSSFKWFTNIITVIYKEPITGTKFGYYVNSNLWLNSRPLLNAKTHRTPIRKGSQTSMKLAVHRNGKLRIFCPWNMTGMVPALKK